MSKSVKRKENPLERVEKGFFHYPGTDKYVGRIKVAQHNHKKFFYGTMEVALANFRKWRLRRSRADPSDKHASPLSEFAGAYITAGHRGLDGPRKPSSARNRESNMMMLQTYWPAFSTLPLREYTEETGAKARVTLSQAQSRRFHKPLSRETVRCLLGEAARLLRYIEKRHKCIGREPLEEVLEGFKAGSYTGRSFVMPTRHQLEIVDAYFNKLRKSESQREVEAHLLYTALMTHGLRLEMALTLRYCDVNLETRTLNVLPNKQSIDKPAERKQIPISPQFAVVVADFMHRFRKEPHAPLFTIKGISGKLKTAAKLANHPRWCHHDCRKYMSTAAIESGIDIPTVADMLFHKDGGITLLRSYRQVCPPHLRASMEKLRLLPSVHVPITDVQARAATLCSDLGAEIGALAPEVAQPILRALEGVLADLRCKDPGNALRRIGHETHSAMSLLGTAVQTAGREYVFGKNVQYLLLAKGMSPTDLAARSGLHLGTIRRLLRDEKASACRVEPIAAAFDVAPDQLVSVKAPKVDWNRVRSNCEFLRRCLGFNHFSWPSLIGHVLAGRNLDCGRRFHQIAKEAGVTAHNLLHDDLAKIGLSPEPAHDERIRNIAANLKLALMVKGSTNAQAASAMKMAPATWRKLLAGKWLPSQSLTNRLALWSEIPVQALCSRRVTISAARLSANLALLIENQPLPKKQLAHAIGVDSDDLAAFTSGVRLPNPVQFKKIADFLQIPAESLLLQDLTPADVLAPQNGRRLAA